MKYILLLFFLSGCFYDPPIKGKDIIIENQTNDFVFVTQNLEELKNLKLYDTFKINNLMYISARPNYIPQYRQWINFLSDVKLDIIKNDTLTFYFLTNTNQQKTFLEINNSNLYKIIQIPIDQIKKNDINNIFYYKDSIVYTNKRDFETRYEKY